MPESYVVRIYRRDRNHPDDMEGMLIAVGTGFRHVSVSQRFRIVALADIGCGAWRKQTKRRAGSVNRLTECEVACDDLFKL